MLIIYCPGIGHTHFIAVHPAPGQALPGPYKRQLPPPQHVNKLRRGNILNCTQGAAGKIAVWLNEENRFQGQYTLVMVVMSNVSERTDAQSL